MRRILHAIGALICKLRGKHRWRKSRELVDTFEVKRCRICGEVRKINKRKKEVAQ